MIHKKPKILLIIPPIIYTRQPSIGAAYLASYLKNRNYEVKIIDLNIEITGINDGDDAYWSKTENCEEFFFEHRSLYERWIEKILNYDPQIIGFTLWTTSKYSSLKIAEMIKEKEKNILIVFGGYLCSVFGRELITYPQVDAVVYGEGEETLNEIAENYYNIKNISGCLIKSNGEIIDGKFRPEIVDLDNLPFPDFPDFPLQKYLFNFFPISFGRGCKWHCTFCEVSNHWKKFRVRSSKNIYQEILSRLKEFSSLEQFEICDPSLNQDLDTISELSDLIINDNLNLKFSGMAQIKPEMDFKFLRKLRNAGFILFNYGIESGSEKVLELMGKNYSPEQAERVIKDTYYAGIDVVLNFIVGYPNEEEEDFYKTLKFIERIKDYVSHIAPGHECRIDGSYIQYHPEKFKVIFSEPHFSLWKTVDGKNTPEIRRRRVNNFNKFVTDLGIQIKCGEDDRE